MTQTSIAVQNLRRNFLTFPEVILNFNSVISISCCCRHFFFNIVAEWQAKGEWRQLLKEFYKDKEDGDKNEQEDKPENDNEETLWDIM